ncbi:PhoX family phosphatase [Alcanivorax sp. 1008]|uniref:PhoX family protein n=1 Tax=Alcanivorax sp. 1008 TaxID=2816853 RepID=UPI001D3AE973|nr:PhoX family phosphatase [Alcanivorax sp. 1008]MCC1495898.1 PhoX family phosphatase [Alcanivorax sp. 1008]
MTIQENIDQQLIDSGSEPMSNLSSNTHMADIIQARFSRRTVLQGTLGAAAVGFLGAGLSGCGGDSSSADGSKTLQAPRITFDAIPTSRADTITLPAGYQWTPLIPWGTPILGSFPAFRDDGMNTGTEQLQQVGSHHDGMHFFPINGASDHGLLVLNHEYIDSKVFHADGPSAAPRPQDEVLKEMAAHGVSVVEVRRSAAGGSNWEVVAGVYNRRITALTEMEMRGPVRGNDKLKTKFSPTGVLARGTLNNCSHGYTPWGTYLTCEENWSGYFRNSTDDSASRPREQFRYGVPHSGQTSRYQWETATPALGNNLSTRFDCGSTGASAVEDFRNEANTMGWIVEIDPFDPFSTPKKRTTMGRFGHEGIVFAAPVVGEPVVFYSGDDARNEYIYKFVSKNVYQQGMRGDDLLDEGILYVAKFNGDGSGEWLALDLDDPTFAAAVAAADGNVVSGINFDGFADQGDVLLNTRLAADIAGATKMDRPEWGAVCPRTGMVYFTLTNNSSRATTDEPNPRASNTTGHIIRWLEDGSSAATSFQWDIFMLAGGTSGPMAGAVFPGDVSEMPLTEDNIAASPDGIWFDGAGVLWIQTDMSGNQQAGLSADGDFGNNQMLAAETDTGVIRRFLVGPKDAEVTGVVMAPDRKTMFVNIQHPGDRSQPGEFTSNFPANDGVSRPRSTTVVITRTDGGVIGV